MKFLNNLFGLKNYVCLISTLLSFYGNTLAQSPKSKPTFGHSKNDIKEQGNEYKKYLAADSNLNSIFDRLVSSYSTDKHFKAKITKSQEIWKSLRLANVDAIYPNDEEPNYYGNYEITCRYIYLTKETKKRIEFLNQWLNGIKEGDVCTGSIKINK